MSCRDVRCAPSMHGGSAGAAWQLPQQTHCKMGVHHRFFTRQLTGCSRLMHAFPYSCVPLACHREAAQTSNGCTRAAARKLCSQGVGSQNGCMGICTTTGCRKTRRAASSAVLRRLQPQTGSARQLAVARLAICLTTAGCTVQPRLRLKESRPCCGPLPTPD